MDVASDGLKPVEASKLRLVKDIRERSELRELSNIEAKRRIAFEAVERASSDLASAEKHRASVEDQLYQEMASLSAMSGTELDRRCHLVIGRFTAEIASRREALGQARIAQEQAQTAVVEARALWAKRAAASHKWRQIERDVQRTTDSRLEFAAEIETDDDQLLRYQGASHSQAVGVSI
ncbi:hypothetical protein ACFKHW_28220 [Bradyrhizobium lupini]|uniref:hypothetical protein n=1 Tax=Rhizobium lupini TaxID=136996 RepID=UPI0036702AC1